jgi:hypothetical protein
MSNKASRAENQQERLIKIGWIIGFVDGEGCFSLGFVKQRDRQEKNRIRRGYRTGYQIFYEFAVTQGESSLKSLEILKDFFGVGALYPNIRYDNHKENLYRYVVRKRADLLRVIIPFFEKYPLQTSKRKNFEMFAKGIKEVEKGNHLTTSGIIRIAQMCEKMNHRKDKSELIKILRNQTSDKQATLV